MNCTAATGPRPKKIKGYISTKHVDWILAIAERHRVRPCVIVRRIVMDGIKEHHYNAQMIAAADRPPKMRMELFFYADARFEEAWEYFKIRNRMTSDTQALRLLIAARYRNWEENTQKTGARQTVFAGFGDEEFALS